MRYPLPFTLSLATFGGYMTAQTVLAFTLPLLAFELSGSGLDLSVIKGAAFLPNIAFAVFIGVLNDRIAKRVSFPLYAGIMALAVTALWLAVSSGRIGLPGLVLFMVTFNAAGYAMANAQTGLIRLTVPEDRLSDATSLASGLNATIATAGPALGGLMLGWLGHEGLIGVLALALLATSALSLAVRPEETLLPPAPFRARLAEGWRVFSRNRELRHMTLVIVLTNAAEGAFGTALLIRMAMVLEIPPTGIGLVLAAAGVGSVLATTRAAAARRRFGYRAAFFWPIWVLAALYLAISQVEAFWLLAALSFVEGAVSLFFAIGVWSYRQESVAAEHMGRVAGITGAIFKLAMPPVILLAGVLADAGSLTGAFVLAAAINVAAGLYLVTRAGWGWPRSRADSPSVTVA